VDRINNHINEVSNNGEDAMNSKDTSFTFDYNNDFYVNFDYGARYDRFMSNSELIEGLSEHNYQKWYNRLKLCSE
jgi:hypothetical protein